MQQARRRRRMKTGRSGGAEEGGVAEGGRATGKDGGRTVEDIGLN